MLALRLNVVRSVRAPLDHQTPSTAIEQVEILSISDARLPSPRRRPVRCAKPRCGCGWRRPPFRVIGN